jgi:PKD repeat protein
MKKLLLITVALFLFAGCRKKKDPIEFSEPPVFSFHGKINGNQIAYESGINGYYMYSSYATDSTNVREFIGDLKLFGCVTGCNNSMKLRIRDYRTLSAAVTDPDTSITTAYYTYAKPSGAPSAYNVTFIRVFSGGTSQSQLWTFPNGSTSTFSVVTKKFLHPGLYNTCLSITSTSACTSSLCNKATVGQTDAVQLTVTNTAVGSAVSFTPNIITGTAPFTYLWDFGDGNTSTQAFPTHTYSAQGAYLITLTVTDALGKSGTINKNVGTQTPGTCITNFNYNSSGISNPLNLSNVTLEWTDPNGVVYTSENNSQPASSSFHIVSVEDYKLNSSGQKTRKIHVMANCTLYNGTSNVLVEGAELVFAVAYP